LGAVEQKAATRKNQVQLINGANLCGKMRKSLGKRNEMSSDDIATITKCFGNFEVVDARELINQQKPRAIAAANRLIQKQKPPKLSPPRFSKPMNLAIAVTIERPLRQSYQFSDDVLPHCVLNQVP
jgi:type I restriction enzyme M protein